MKITDKQKQKLRDKWNKEMSYLLENKHIDSDAYFNWWLSQIESLECPEIKTPAYFNWWLSQIESIECPEIKIPQELHDKYFKEVKTAEEILKENTDYPDRYMNVPMVQNTFLVTPKEAIKSMHEYASQFKPVLPSDEEIGKFCRTEPLIHPRMRGEYLQNYFNGLTDGVKWLRDQIEKQTK
jgi:hypothetical protein